MNIKKLRFLNFPLGKEKKLKKKQIGYDCSCCDFAEKLPNKDLENDFVYCCNPDCEFYYQVLFEHFRCQKKKKQIKKTKNNKMRWKD